MCRIAGGYEACTPVYVEPLLKYGPSTVWFLTRRLRGHRLVGSLTGVVASKSVTEASKGALGRLVTGLIECNGIRALDWEADMPSRQETGA